jgi:hypothetical protein
MLRRAALVACVLFTACASAPTKSGAFPPGRGWSCLDDGKVGTLCFRDESTCRAVNDDAKGVCRPASLAHCFTYARDGKDEYVCLTSPDDCDGFAKFLAKKPEVTNVSACSPLE